MADPRIIGTETADGFTFKVAWIAGAKGEANVYLPNVAPPRDPLGTQAEQSQGRVVIDLGQFEVRFDIVPATDPLPGYTPVVTVQNLTIGEDGVLNGQFAATDIDENIDPNSWVEVGSLAGFTLNADGSFTYTPPASFQSLNVGETLAAPVVVRVSDTDGNQSGAQSFDIAVTGAADAPVINVHATIVTDALTPVLFDTSATDPEDDVSATGWAVSTAPLKGILTVAPSGVGHQYDPNGEFGALGANNFEDVTFSLTVVDDEATLSAPQGFTVRVFGAAHAPVAVAGGVLLNEDQTTPTAFDLAALCSDVDADIVSYEMLTQPADLTVVFNPATGLGTLTPVNAAFQSLKTGQTATRPFSFRCVDGLGNNSNAAVFTPTIQGADDAPVALPRQINVNAGARESAILGYTDIDSAGLFAGVAFQFVGPLFDVATGETTGVGQIVLLNNTNVPIGSIAAGRAQMRADNGDFDTLAAGTVRNLRQLYQVRDAEGNWSASEQLNVTVTGTYQAAENMPVMTPVAMTTPAGVPVQIDLIGFTSDADGDFKLWVIDAQPVDALGVAKGSIALVSDGTYATGRLVFSPGNAFDGLLAGSSETVTGRVSHRDQNDNPSNLVNVSVNVTGVLVVNPPNAQNLDLTVEFDAASVAGQCVASDPDGDLDPNGYLKTADPIKGILAVSATGGATFQTNGEFAALAPGTSEQVQGRYSAADAGARTDEAFITVTVINSSDPGTAPRINNITRQCDWQASFIDGVLTSHTVDTENDVDPATFVMTTNVLEGTLTPPDGTPDGYWKFEPGASFLDLAPGAARAVFFEATVEDEAGNISTPGRVTINVSRPAAAPQSPPVAGNFSITIDADQTFAGNLPVATDVDGDLNANGYALVDGGNAAVDGVIAVAANRAVTYDPAGAFDGLMVGQQATRAFTYTASDAGGRVSSPATINVTINGVAAMAMEPTYPAMSALASKYPFEQSGMSRFMALEMAFPATKTSVKSGAWSDATVWSPAGVPQAGDNVCIEYGHTVTLNEARTAAFAGNKAYGFVCVHGTLAFASFMNVRLRCDTLIGFYGAHLAMQPAAGIVHEVSFPANGDINTANDPALLTRGMVWHGTTTVKDANAGTASEKDPYVNCLRSAVPVAGASSITLAQAPVGWAVSDRIVIPCSDQDRSDGANIPTFEDEEVTITAINGAIVSFTPALVFNHDELPVIQTDAIDFGDGHGAGGDWPELTICNFTRQIKFTNEAGNTIPDWQRPHIMLMHRTNADGIIFCGAEVNDFGRTRKIQQAFTSGQMGSNPIVFDTNLKGRYALHLHWVGVDPTDDINAGAALIERNAFYRSPGWNFAQHRGSANVKDNVSWNAFGHFVAEGGDETGEWRGNVAMRGPARRTNGSTGNVKIAKAGEFVDRHDHAATGQGFFFMGRLVKAYASARGWNRMYGSHGDGVVWMHRPGGGGYVTATHDFGPHLVNASNWEHGAAVGFQATGWEPDKPRIGRSENWQVTGCFRGLHVVKNAPQQDHDVRTFFTDFIVTGCLNGIEQQYTQHYTNRRFVIVRSKRAPSGAPGEGIVIFNNTPDIVNAYGKIGGHPAGVSGGFRKAIETTHIHVGATNEPVAGAWGYIFDNIKFGAQVGLSANGADMPTFLETRTGQDGVTGPEDRAFSMTFFNPQAGAIEAFGAPPNPYATDAHSMAFYRATGALNPPAATTWDQQTQNFQYLGTVTDAYGVRRAPAYYGNLDAFYTQNDSNDWIRRQTTQLLGILNKLGYWREPGGAYFVEDTIISSNRMLDAPLVQQWRLYIAATTPGVGNSPKSALFGDKIFNFNGVKA